MLTTRRLAPYVLAAVLLVGGCSGDSDGGKAGKEDRATTTTSPGGTKGSTEVKERTVLGVAKVTVGETAWDFDLTSCVAAKDRLTVQGDDGKGQTVVASFAIGSKAGSVTVAGPDDAWAIGPAGGTEIADAKVGARAASGRGTFTRRTFSVAEAPGEARTAGASESPTEGSFELRCEKDET